MIPTIYNAPRFILEPPPADFYGAGYSSQDFSDCLMLRFL